MRRWLAAPMLLKMMFGEGGNDGGARLNVMAAPPVAPAVAPAAAVVAAAEAVENAPQVVDGEENGDVLQGGGDEQGVVQPAH